MRGPTKELRHGVHLGRELIDPYCSGRWFDGWWKADLLAEAPLDSSAVEPCYWLVRTPCAPVGTREAVLELVRIGLRMKGQARHGEPEDLTVELGHLMRGGPGARTSAVNFLQQELRAIAQGYLRSERGQVPATELVNAAYLKLFDRSSLGVGDRKHFFAVAARAMRQILVDQYRRRSREEPARAECAVTLSEPDGATDVLDLNELEAALVELTRLDERQARIVELRYFTGLEMSMVADVLEVSKSTVEREWRVARAWLAARLGGANPR